MFVCLLVCKEESVNTTATQSSKERRIKNTETDTLIETKMQTGQRRTDKITGIHKDKTSSDIQEGTEADRQTETH